LVVLMVPQCSAAPGWAWVRSAGRPKSTASPRRSGGGYRGVPRLYLWWRHAASNEVGLLSEVTSLFAALTVASVAIAVVAVT
jgi:hypothetical protein